MDHCSKTLLITGGAGFIGTNFVRYVLHHRPDWHLVDLDALTYAGNPANFEDLAPHVSRRHQLIKGDIRDSGLLKRLFEDHAFDGVIHFAAESHVDRSILGPEAFLETNVTGTFRLLEASRTFWEKAGRPEGFRFLHVSTDEVYGSLSADGLFTEYSPYDPSSPYSASKAASDHFVNAYYRTYALPSMITNCSNNYGPYQFPEKLIPLMILNILEEKPLPVYGDGKNIRDWLFVTDHCSALLKVLENGTPGETYNVGGNSERENIDIIHLLCELVDSHTHRSGARSGKRLIHYVPDRPGHDRRYAIDASKIQRELQWHPEVVIEKGLEATVGWYLNNLEWVKSIQSGEYRKWIELNYRDR